MNETNGADVQILEEALSAQPPEWRVDPQDGYAVHTPWGRWWPSAQALDFISKQENKANTARCISEYCPIMGIWDA